LFEVRNASEVKSAESDARGKNLLSQNEKCKSAESKSGLPDILSKFSKVAKY
jgi:hypothetical protein